MIRRALDTSHLWSVISDQWLPVTGHCSLVALFFWRPLFTRLIVAHGDTLLLFYPVWDYRAEALRAGRIPLWNPLTFLGAPFLANSQYGVLYPLNWPLAWLGAPAAFEVAVVLHLAIAAFGAQAFAQQVVGLRPFPGWFAAALFALGGYSLAHVESVNQLQGLAWLPWVFWALSRAFDQPKRFLAPLTFFLSLQLLAGHTQTTFITLVGGMVLSVSTIASHAPRSAPYALRPALAPSFFLLPLSFVLACLLAAAQLLPTYELSQYSLRAGGLPVSEAVSFSLDPRLIGRALLPAYSRALFGEFNGALGVVGLCLALMGFLNPLRSPLAARHLPLVTLAALGLLLALGQFNPLYVALVKFVPGFNLFRVPARWLALWAFGGAMAAGLGIEALGSFYPRPRHVVLAFGVIVGLIGLAYLAAGLTPPGETGPLAPPEGRDLALWLGAALIVLIGSSSSSLLSTPYFHLRAPVLATAAVLELFLASRVQSFNRLIAPDVYDRPRPSVEFLLASGQAAAEAGRVVAASRLFYDPTLNGVKLSDRPPAAELPPDATYEYLVAAKYQDVFSHNLPLKWGVPTLDGYDGGILPLRTFVTFEEYLLGRPPQTTDGRVRENIVQTPADIPDGRALSLANVRWFIADKTFDFWIDGVYYDFTHKAFLPAGAAVEVAALPEHFAADSLGVVSFLRGAGKVAHGAPVAEIEIEFADAPALTFTLRAGLETAEGDYGGGGVSHSQPAVAGNFWPDRPEVDEYWAVLQWPERRQVRRIRVRGLASEGEIVVHGMTLIDGRGGAFAPLVVSSRGRYRLAYSGDVKVYENLDALPRAFVVQRVEVIPDAAQAIARMRAPNFDPAETAILADSPSPVVGEEGSGGGGMRAEIVLYRPEHVVVEAASPNPAFLVLADAYYPGWVATVDGQPAPIYRADLMFRAVAVPAGEHTVEFRFAPRTFVVGVWISLLSGALLLLVAAKPMLDRPRQGRGE